MATAYADHVQSPADLADAIAEHLARVEADLVREQAVRGIDALDEVELHPILVDAFVAAEFGVTREARYPSERRHWSENEGDRCDLVLTDAGRELLAERKRATLFDPPDAVPPDEALWVEVKTVAQFHEDGPNGRYAIELGGPIRRDVQKLARDPAILRSALVVLLFVSDPSIARHDLDVWLREALDRGLPVGEPCVREVPLSDRLGHSTCAVAVFPVSSVR
jgi:hypothetical protein